MTTAGQSDAKRRLFPASDGSRRVAARLGLADPIRSGRARILEVESPLTIRGPNGRTARR